MPSTAQILSGVELDSLKTVETAWQPLKLHHRGGVGDRHQEESEWRCESRERGQGGAAELGGE